MSSSSSSSVNGSVFEKRSWENKIVNLETKLSFIWEKFVDGNI